MKEKYKDIYGTWIVTTEDDVEGKSIRNLGTFTGYVDEITLHLADKCFYSLTFEKVEPVTEYVPKRKEVNVRFDIDSGTWNKMDLSEIRNVFKNRPVQIINSDYFAAFKIVSHYNVEKDLKTKKALDKLTNEEKKLLDLI